MSTSSPSRRDSYIKCSALWGFLYFILHTPFLIAQTPPIEWDRTLGGTNWEELNTIVPVKDGLVFGGTSQSLGWAYPSNGEAYPDFSLFKLDMQGDLLWNRAYGGVEEDRLWSLVQTADGGFLLGGFAKSDRSGNKTDSLRGGKDFWIVRTDSEGKKLWDRAYGGDKDDELFSILPLENGDFLLSGISNSTVSGEKTQPSRGNNDLWILRIDSLGNVLWDKTIGGNGYDRINSHRASIFAPDGMVILAGGTTSNKGSWEISNDNKFDGLDFWAVKINPKDGSLIWNHRYGGHGADLAYGIRLSRDKSFYYVYGESSSLPQPSYANGKKAPFKEGIRDFWIMKIDLNGEKLPDFDLTFGGKDDDGCYDIDENIYGDVILVGYSNSPEIEVYGDYDWYVQCVNKFGEPKWDWILGGNKLDAITNIERLEDGSLVLFGHSNSNRSDVKTEENIGKNDYWIVKTGCKVQAEILGDPGHDPCSGELLNLEILATGCDDCLYFWENFGEISTTKELPIGFADSVTIFVADPLACIDYDTGYFEVFPPNDFTFGTKDTTFLSAQSVTIGGNYPYLQYQWNTSDTTSSLVVSHAGVYTVTVTDENGCTASDWIRVRASKKDAVYIPNVFTPDFDGNNDYFNVYTDYSVKRVVTLQVYDRWGDMLFKHDDYVPNFEKDGWDGMFHGKRMMPGNYKYACIIEFIDGSQEIYDGIVTIVR